MQGWVSNSHAIASPTQMLWSVPSRWKWVVFRSVSSNSEMQQSKSERLRANNHLGSVCHDLKSMAIGFRIKGLKDTGRLLLVAPLDEGGLKNTLRTKEGNTTNSIWRKLIWIDSKMDSVQKKQKKKTKGKKKLQVKMNKFEGDCCTLGNHWQVALMLLSTSFQPSEWQRALKATPFTKRSTAACWQQPSNVKTLQRSNKQISC